MGWLQAQLLEGGRGLLGGPEALFASSLPLAAAGGVACALVLRRGGSLFRMLLAAAFAYLALQALQNWSRFALVAGAVLSWNYGEWAVAFAAAAPGRRLAAAGWALRAGLAGVLGVWLAALAADRYYPHTGEPRHFAFREEPLAFAHDAAVFAGRPGLPGRALVYGLDQTGVYVFHNAPRCKPFMDGRLEMPDRATFETYRNVEDWLRAGDPRWEKAVGDMGNPLLLLAHEGNYDSEAHLLAHPGWRCVYYDALASVFVPRGAADEREFPAVDFAGRHFREAGTASVPDVRGAAAREEKALFNLAQALVPAAAQAPESARRWRVPVLLAALDRAGRALAEEPDRADAWMLLGNCYWALSPPHRGRPHGPAEGWEAAEGLPWAQTTYCLRRALECRPDHPAAWRYLFESYAARGMADAQLAAGEQWLLCDLKATARQREQVGALRAALGEGPPAGVPPPSQVPVVVTQLLHQHRPAAALRVIEGAGQGEAPDWAWPFAEQVAGLYMQLGRPDEARRVWARANDCPAPAVRHCRLAGTFWVERDFDAALRHLRAARAADPHLGEACWALARLLAERGDAAGALEAARQGLRLSLSGRERADLDSLQTLLLPYGPPR
jgi:tetratricopeptide (TPR) repeat protein